MPSPEPPPIQRIALIGAGRAGREFALRCAAAGFHVIVEDVMPANLRRAQEEYNDLADASSGHLELAHTVEDAVRNADLALDFVPDELESKLEIFSMIDRMAPPRTIIVTPTQTLSITDLASCTYRPTQCFAVRGVLAAGATTRLIAPASASATALEAVKGFLLALAPAVTVEDDADAPMLMKNLA